MIVHQVVSGGIFGVLIEGDSSTNLASGWLPLTLILARHITTKLKHSAGQPH